MILAVCAAGGWFTAWDVGRALRFNQKKLTSRHLTPMVEEGLLELRYPDKVRHPKQAYRTRDATKPDALASRHG